MRILLGDYPHTRALKAGTTGLDATFPQVKPMYPAFAKMVRELAYDIGELALATYLQARDAGVPITALPVVMVGNTHHHSLTRLPERDDVTPERLRGARVGVRSYTQTTGMWVRGVLSEEHRIAADEVTWVTTEGPHVAHFTEPDCVQRSAAATVAELVRGGDVAAAVLGPKAIGGQSKGLVPVIPDAADAAAAWVRRHGTIPVNHLVVVRDDVLKRDPDAVLALYRALADEIDATAAERDPATFAGRVVAAGWTDELARSLELAGRYSLEQGLVRSPVDVGAIERAAAFVARGR